MIKIVEYTQYVNQVSKYNNSSVYKRNMTYFLITDLFKTNLSFSLVLYKVMTKTWKAYHNGIDCLK